MRWLFPALLLGACGTGQQGNSGGSYMSMSSAGRETSEMRIDKDGRIFGANFDLVVTPDGYRGLLGGGLTMMSVDPAGERISGTRDGRIIDMHVDFDGVTIKATGLFAGRLGRLQIDQVAITSSVGRCGFELTRQTGLHYTGQRGCSNGYVAPVSLDLPPDFLRLSIPRKVMLLAALLYI
jgi:hypothetical protein